MPGNGRQTSDRARRQPRSSLLTIDAWLYGFLFVKGWCRILLLAPALSLAGCGDRPPPLPGLGSSEVVLAFGDSLTYGTGAATPESYPVVLSAIIGRPVISAGVPGDTTAAGLERLPAVLDEIQPKLMLLCMGGNDMLRKLDSASTEANLRAMVQLAKSRGIGVVLIGVPAPEIFGGPPAYYARIAQEFALPLENEALKDILFDRSLKADPIHPNAAGYRRFAEAVAALLRKAGAV